MAEKKVKFKISIKELSVEFEGDIHTAERIQQQVTGAINNLATSPNRLLSNGQQEPTPEVIDISPTRRRRRRRSKPADAGSAHEALPDHKSLADGENEPARRSTRHSDGQVSLITVLATDGFFKEQRTVGQIRDQLSKKGYSFKTSELTPTLGRLTRTGVLQRDKNANNQWAYFS